MKKLLLSSIIMLGVCGIASAQTDSKVKQRAVATTSATAPTPQRATFTTAAGVGVATPSTTAVAADAAATTTAATAPSPKTVVKTTTNEAGVATPSDEAKKREAKMAAVKAANAARPAAKQVN